MNRPSPHTEFEAIQQAFQDLWRRDRTVVAAWADPLLSRLKSVEMAQPDKVDWEHEFDELTGLSAAAAASVAEIDAGQKETFSHAILLWAVGIELALNPTAKKQAVLRGLSRHSWILEHSLTHIILTAMNEDAVTHETWLEAIKQGLPGPEALVDEGGARSTLPDWGELFRPNMSHAGVEPLMTRLQVLLEADKPYLFQYLDSLTDWGLMEHALLFSGAVSSFEAWAVALSHVPLTFDSSGNWTGIKLGLVLMRRAQEELLLTAGEGLFGRAKDEAPWRVEHVVAAIQARADALPLLRSLAVVAFRDYVGHLDSSSRQANPRITSKISRLKDILNCVPADLRVTRVSGDLPAGYPAWFSWYERGLESHWHVERGGSAVPSAQVLSLYEQAVTWDSKESLDVRNLRTQIGYGRSEMFVGALDLLLGATLAESSDAVASWERLWSKTLPLREVVEFGGYSGDESQGWQDRSATSGLTELVIRLGLAASETILQSPSKALDVDTLRLHSLIGMVQASSLEMLSIEVLRSDVWTHALRYCLVLWAKLREAPHSQAGSSFTSQPPPERLLIEHLSTDPPEMLLALTACANNGIQEQTLMQQLADSGVPFDGVTTQARRLSEESRPRQRLPAPTFSLADRLVEALSRR